MQRKNLEYKKCSKCGESKPLSMFSKNGTGGIRPDCKPCNSKVSQDYNRRNKEKISIRMKEYGLKNKDKIDAFQKKYREDNRELLRIKQKEIKARMPEEVRAWNKKYRAKPESKEKYNAYRRNKYKTDVAFKLRDSVSRYINKIVQKNGKSTSKIMTESMGYSIDDLRKHLERQFTKGMSWRNHGRKGWNIDHINPVSKFNIKKCGDKEFKACWALSNLRPLWEKDNQEKKNKRTHLL